MRCLPVSFIYWGISSTLVSRGGLSEVIQAANTQPPFVLHFCICLNRVNRKANHWSDYKDVAHRRVKRSSCSLGMWPTKVIRYQEEGRNNLIYPVHEPYPKFWDLKAAFSQRKRKGGPVIKLLMLIRGEKVDFKTLVGTPLRENINNWATWPFWNVKGTPFNINIIKDSDKGYTWGGQFVIHST